MREATPRGVKAYEVTPSELGVGDWELEEVLGGDAAENARALREALAGQGEPAHRDAIAVNAGALLYLAGPADNLADGTRMALEQLASGAAGAHLESMTTAAQLAARAGQAGEAGAESEERA